MSEQAKYPPYDDRSFPDPRGLRDEVGTWEGMKALSLMNIDISLRRVADSIDIRKELDAKTEECKKLNEELSRLRVNCDMYADARDKAIAEKEAIERRITKELSGGVVQVQSDLAAANQCIEEVWNFADRHVWINGRDTGSVVKTSTQAHNEEMGSIIKIINAYREKNDKEEAWRRSR